MAACLVCGSEVGDESTFVQLYDCRLSVCHAECFTCCKCSCTLTRTTYQWEAVGKKLYCEKHYVHSSETKGGGYLKEMRELKSKCLGYAVARRKSSTAFQIQVPVEACSCLRAHNVRQVPGYWVECWETEEGDEDRIAAKNRGDVSLTSYDQEIYGKLFYGSEHWNYFADDETLGPVTVAVKLETEDKREFFRILIRTQTGISHGLLPIGYLAANRYDRDDIIQAISAEIGLNPPLKIAQLSFASAPDELIKLDQVFVKSELKVGIVYIKNGQTSEEEILKNCEHSSYFDEFLDVLGMKVKLKGFTGYRGGLDTVNDFTGKFSIYTKWKDIEIMYHVSTLLPYEERDPQKLQRKRHIGNDILCVVFLDPGDTEFVPNTIKSHFLHTFIVVKPVFKEPLRFAVSVVSRDEVPAYNPSLSGGHVFEKGPGFREWMLTKIINGERACYTAPKFARMQDRTRLQMLEELVGGFQVHLESLHGRDIRKLQSRRGSWLPISYCRPPAPLGDIIKDRFEGHDQLSKDFAIAFRSNKLCDITFIVGKDQVKLHGVRAILAVRSRVFQEMLYGKVDVSTSPIPEPKISSAPNSPVTKKTFIRISNRKCNSHHDILKRASSEGAKDDSLNGLEAENRITSSLHNLNSDKQKQNVGMSFFNPEKNKLHKNQVCPIFLQLDRYLNFESARELLQKILSMAEILTEDLLQQPGFIRLPMSIMQHIMSRNIQVSEIVKFNALLRWAKVYSQEYKVSKIGIMNSMAEYIKFHLIKPSDLMKIVVPSKCVPSEKIIMSLAYQVDPESVPDLQQSMDGSGSDKESPE